MGRVEAGWLGNETSSISPKPWQRLTADDLRAMAAQRFGPDREVRFFYRDEDLVIGRPVGRRSASEDAFYVLQDGISRPASCPAWGR
jgi:hypothetical protein